MSLTPQLQQCCCGCSLRTATIIIGIVTLLGSIFATVSVGLAESGHGSQTFWLALDIIWSLVRFVELIVSIVMLVGAIKDQYKLILPWIIWETIVTCLEVLDCLLSGMYLMIMVGHIAEGIGYLAAIPFVAILSYYLILVVYSHYRNLRGEITVRPDNV